MTNATKKTTVKKKTSADKNWLPQMAALLKACADQTRLRLLNLVEDHAMTFLYDAQQGAVERCDGFYNETLFASPYPFGAGSVDLVELVTGPGLLRAGNRMVLHPDGALRPQPVYLQFLHFSQTDYEAALVEGDIPGTIQLMGRAKATLLAKAPT